MKQQHKLIPAIPTYFLYGETEREVEQQFIHIETVRSRSRQYEWSIQPHVHSELHQVLFLEKGSAKFVNDANDTTIHGPTLVSVPAQSVHGFVFEAETEGWVVTLSSVLLWRITQNHSEFQPLLHRSVVAPIDPESFLSAKLKFATLFRESNDDRVGCRAAAEGAFLSILIDLIRIDLIAERLALRHYDSDIELVSRYKTLIEKHFRSRLGAAEYAARLCVCHERLRLACTRVTGTAPLALLNSRRLLEAKRYLAYSGLSIAEVAYQSGFEDPAYFSRFFARSSGKTPRDFRLNAIGRG